LTRHAANTLNNSASSWGCHPRCHASGGNAGNQASVRGTVSTIMTTRELCYCRCMQHRPTPLQLTPTWMCTSFAALTITVIRGLALGTLNDRTRGQFLAREIKMAASLSCILSIAGFCRAIAFRTTFPDAIAVTSESMVLCNVKHELQHCSRWSQTVLTHFSLSLEYNSLSHINSLLQHLPRGHPSTDTGVVGN
jgi:hypothetical protein